MSATWWIHNDKPHLDFVDDGFIALGWSRMPDLREIRADREAMKAAITAAHPAAKPGAIPVWAGVLLRFAFDMRPEDLVVHPEKADSTVSIGRVEGEYTFDAAVPQARHRRRVRWLQTGIPRDAFSAAARYELGSSITLFRIRRHEHEFRAMSPMLDAPARGSYTSSAG